MLTLPNYTTKVSFLIFFFLLLDCSNKDNKTGKDEYSIGISESLKNNLFIYEYEPNQNNISSYKKKYNLNEVWVEKKWTYSNKGIYIYPNHYILYIKMDKMNSYIENIYSKNTISKQDLNIISKDNNIHCGIGICGDRFCLDFIDKKNIPKKINLYFRVDDRDSIRITFTRVER